jgi:hypothetical protein
MVPGTRRAAFLDVLRALAVLSSPTSTNAGASKKELAEAEAEFDAATRLSEINRAAGRLHRERAALKQFDAEGAKKPKRPTTRGHGAASS